MRCVSADGKVTPGAQRDVGPHHVHDAGTEAGADMLVGDHDVARPASCYRAADRVWVKPTGDLGSS